MVAIFIDAMVKDKMNWVFMEQDELREKVEEAEEKKREESRSRKMDRVRLA